MKRTPLKKNPEKIRAWIEKSRQKKTAFKTKKHEIAKRTSKRSSDERHYRNSIPAFLAAHPVCPVTGERATEIHHSARRQGEWLNLRRYWIAVSHSGHVWIENNGTKAEAHGLMVRIRETYKDHVAKLVNEDLDQPIFYETWSGTPIFKSIIL